MHSTIFTIGHSTRAFDVFVALLRENDIDILVDVRAYPGSRRYPHFNKDNLQEAIPEAGMRYEHLLALGGRRKKSKDAVPSPNIYWDNIAFRNYADYALSDEFRAGLAQLETLASEATCAIMCSEAVWWRCHRRIITDYLLSDGIAVMHIMGEGKADKAQMTEAARPAGEHRLIYDVTPGGQEQLFPGPGP